MTTLVSADPLSPDVVLEGRVVRLVPLALEHVPGLLQAASISRDSYQWTTVPATEAAMRDYVETAIRLASQRHAVPFATLLKDSGRVVGTSRLATFEFHPWGDGSPSAPTQGLPDVVEIGWTWLASDVQRTAVNTEAKLLMLTHAFETWGVKAVRLKTDRRNERSWNAILRLGAKFDGIIRAHSPGADGLMRDSAYFSILAEEWPWVRSGLQTRLAG
jgi:RimJ/RimL family protein N-acetyltransferase